MEQLIGRISAEHKTNYRILTSQGEISATISGRKRYEGSFPAVGDWVVFSMIDEGKRGVIDEILPRKTKVSRKIPGKVEKEQVIAANVDFIFIVSSLNREFNLRRLERYLAMVYESGARPVIILNKADLAHNIREKKKAVESISVDIPVHIISAKERNGIGALSPYLEKGITVGLLGSSGVGKSTLINAIMDDDILRTESIRSKDDRGRHTTSAREMIILEEGGIIIDNPGMREIQLWGGARGINDTFGDINELGSRCKFKDCRHITEPNCAVKKAVEDGLLPETRLKSYSKLAREVNYENLKESMTTSRAVERAKWDKIISEANEKDGFDHKARAAHRKKLKDS